QIERREWGNFYGTPVRVLENGTQVETANEAALLDAFEQRLDRALDLYHEVKDIEQGDIGKINYQLEKLRLKQRKYELDDELTEENLAEIDATKAALNDEYQVLQQKRQQLYDELSRDTMVMMTADGREKEIPFSQIVGFIAPNTFNTLDQLAVFAHNFWNFLSEEPREANTEGGVFPAIFGTVVMVLLMSLLVTPFGVIAAVYLREYAKQGIVTRTVRIAVNNLAGVPSIVYGVFGLGFFVYFLGGSIDELFYPEAAPAPVFGTPGLMWASLTLALLTVPVVIVATEEGLSRIPRSLREGSYALGATKFETMIKVIIPMASPAIMTGMILAVARAAGEVAPLMLVGVVKLAPTLPLDGNAPFLHLDRKFMHLGFHIYDVGFQSPNVEAARPLVYATAGLLVAVIGFLNLAAVYIRNNLREKYKALEM
ncbi:MAG TPA: phosphate ABC transporter permease PtsA, partial [Gammaproteobacteria bacterium]|nr:phosphate ABC transporter permease PtsA [Gammaproteobacteria bacterium]